MESVCFVGIDIKVIAWDAQDDCAVAEDWLEVPPAVDANNVEDYVFGRFGEPVDVAVGTTAGFGELVLGWVFPPRTLERVDLPSEGLEMMVVPFVRFPDGTRRELFEYSAELHREFAELVATIDPDASISNDPAPIECDERLEDEHLVLFDADRDKAEQQIAGWLRRMITEGWTYLILEVVDTGRYVQFLAHDGSWLRGEVVGNRYLQDHEPLSSDEYRALCDVGWNEPHDSGDDCGNFWVDWGDEDDSAPEVAASMVAMVSDRDVREAARFAAAALCDVFCVRGAAQVAVTSGPASHAGD